MPDVPIAPPTSRRRRARLIAAPVTLTLAVSGAAFGLPASAAPSSGVVISEVYGGGGNSGAPYSNDFVELYNLSGTPVDLSTYVVQYFSATATTPASTTPLTGTLAPGASYLVQQSAGATASAPLPTPDATGTATMSAANGRVDLLTGTTLVDRVGYGTATTSEGSAAPATSNTTSVSRTSPCTDTDANAADFTLGTPSPRNSAAGPQPCTVAPPAPVEAESIEQIQGAGHLSTYAGNTVDGVRGVVTALSRNGFWMQDTTPDADPATSAGLFVFTRTAPTVQVGDDISVDGAVTEFRPGGAGGNDNLTTTQVTGPTITVIATAATLPAPVVLGVDRTAPPQTIEAGDPGSLEDPQAPFRPATDAIDFYESLEGMLVGVRDAQVVGPTASFGEIPVVPGRAPADTVRSRRGGVVYSGDDHPNASRIQLDDALLPLGAMPAANVGDRIPGQTDGVLDYSFANYKLLVTAAPVVASRSLRREVTERQGRDQVAVATFNVENLAPSDPATKFERLARQIVTNLRAPDVLALEEIQDDSGAADDGVVTSAKTVATLVAAITAAGGPAYQARSVDPTDGTDGGQPGGNIRQVLLFRSDRGLSFVDRTAAGADPTTTATQVTAGETVAVTLSPGRIAPADPAWRSSRKPLVGEFRVGGQSLFVIANHFASKGGDDPLFGRVQQPVRSSEVQRVQQATLVRGFVDQLLAADPAAKVVVLGDINDFEFSQTADVLVGSGRTALTDLPRTLPVKERYTYVFQGNSQVLDHILISPSLAGATTPRQPVPYRYDIVHTNAEFADQDSDHDPQIVRLALHGGH